MLFLQPPYQIIEGVVIFRDHANEQQFYYLPAVPHLSTRLDETLGVEVPSIYLVKFRDTSMQGSFLNLEVNLGIDDEKLDEIRGRPVRLIGLGHKNRSDIDDDADEAEDDVNAFEVIVDQAVSPALYGDNQAIFSISLDARATQLVEASMSGSMLPIGVIYSLDYFALRPAFTVKVTAEWDRVQEHFQESFGVEAFFYQQQIDEIVDSLIEERIINIEVDSFLPEGEDAGSWVGRRDQAVDELKDLVLESFFTPSLDPIAEEEDTWDKIVGTVYRLGNYSPFTFKYTKVDQTRIDEKRLNAQMNERTTVRKTIFPQAHLSGLNQVVRDTGLDLSHFIKNVTLDDPWFQTRKVTAHALLDFEHDSVESINVNLRYGSGIKTLRLTAEENFSSTEWLTLVDRGGSAMRAVEMDYKVAGVYSIANI